MADPEALKAARKGREAFQNWLDRRSSEGTRIDLSGASLPGVSLRWVNFAGAILDDVDFSNADLTGAYFGPGSISRREPIVSERDYPLSALRIRFDRASLLAATFNYAVCVGASFRASYLALANFRQCDLSAASFRRAALLHTSFSGQDLRTALDLNLVVHYGPSFLDIDTLRLSGNTLSSDFTEGAGISKLLSEYLPSLNDTPAVQFYSCFISHSSADKNFCEWLCRQLRRAGLRVWYAPEELAAGRKLVKQIQEAIHVYDKLLLVLSPNSMRSGWVANEIRWARRREMETAKQVLFPISLVSHTELKQWSLVDEETGEDLASEIRGYFVPDFSNWADPKTVETRVARLLKDLTAQPSAPRTFGA
jgi:hypothetical protein